MPRVRFGNAEVECAKGENLRKVLLRNHLPLYNGIASSIHCRGLGTCGTCAVEVEGPVSEKTIIEKWRLNFPPHRPESELRLACQCTVQGDLTVFKHNGMWGQTKSDRP